MRPPVQPSTIDVLTELEKEMAAARRTEETEALREALAALARPSRGWLTTGQAAERLDITIPTVKDWIKRGTLTGRLLGSRWLVAEESVSQVQSLRQTLADLAEDGYPSEEELYNLTKRVRRQMAAEKRARVARQ